MRYTLVNSYKVVFIGLAEVGKSTIVRMITKGRIGRKCDDFTATIDYDKFNQTFADDEITIFDLGGCTAFLDRFIGEMAESIFSGVKTVVFVVDPIEIKNISCAKYYFDLSLKKLDQFSPEAPIFLFQNKFDLVPKKMRAEVHRTIKNYLLEGVIRNIHHYETSVFDTSIVIAMSVVYKATLGYIPNNWFSLASEMNKESRDIRIKI